MNDEDKRNRKEYILNNKEKGLEVSTALVLKEILIVSCCGYVTSSRYFEHR